MATELCLLSSTLLQISGLQGQALGQSLASLVVARRQLWLSQARVSDADKAVLLDALISLGHTFRPAVEILQRSLRERETSWQVVALLPPRAPQAIPYRDSAISYSSLYHPQSRSKKPKTPEEERAARKPVVTETTAIGAVTDGFKVKREPERTAEKVKLREAGLLSGEGEASISEIQQDYKPLDTIQFSGETGAV
ncbi:UNVERIFIED_CONTAM: hypothetical protein FKN15_006869 [Acipenser sinensis]